jgi:hypothetical protein
MAPPTTPPLLSGTATLASWTFFVYGATLILSGSLILKGLRTWIAARSYWLGKLIHCPMCVGFWVGLLSWFLLPELCPIQNHFWVLAALANGFSGSAVCWVIHVVLTKLGAEDL